MTASSARSGGGGGGGSRLLLLLQASLVTFFLLAQSTNFVATAWMSGSSFSFSSTSFSSPLSKQRQSFTSTSHNVIFTRLSEDCISALTAAQEEASHLKQSQVDNPCMLAGISIVSSPPSTSSTSESTSESTSTSTSTSPPSASESLAAIAFAESASLAAIKPVLQEFHISHAKIRNVLEYLQPTSSTASSAPKLSDFKKLTDPDAAKVELPLAAALQQTLFDAGQISNSMGASAIEPHHVFLALLNYKEVGETGEAQAATRSDDCEAMEILYHLDATLEGEDICFSLLQTLLQQQQQQQQQQQKEKEKEGASNNASKDEDASSSASSSSSAAASSSSSSSKEPIISGTGAAMSEAKEKARSLLQECGVDLTLMAREGQLDKVHGRDAEIQACFQTLVRRRKNNVCLIGEAGVGKTCIVEQLAQILVTPELCPPFLEGHRIISLEVGALLAGTKFRGEFEERLRTIIEILSNSRTKSILFIDEIHNLVGAGGNSEGNMDASNILKPYLARGQLQVIGATTITEYNRHIAKDAALERRFQPVLIREPTVEETVDILNAVLPFYRSHHKVEYTNSSLEAAARLSDRYINDRFLPDKAIDVLDEAGAMATLKRNRFDIEPPTVTDKSITDIISQWTNIPVGKLEMDEMDRLQLLEENLGRRVKGQERAVRTVAKAIRRARTGIRNPRRPVASFLFCGPTGTGKTELCKALADTYYGSERDLIRIDMSEYMEKSSISRLTGPPPGLVGYEEGGQLTEAVRRSPHSVVLLDELEKAHVDVLNLLLQVLEDGILTDGKGRTISFKNTVLIMTSNIGSKRILDLVQKHEQGQGQQQQQRQSPSSDTTNGDKESSLAKNDPASLQRIEYTKLARVVKKELEKAMKPEFLNRIDDIVVFQPLTANELSLIAFIMVVDITARAKMEKDIDIHVSPELLETMVQQGSGAASQFGARPMRRAIQRILEDAISDAVVKSFLLDSDVATFGKKEMTPNGSSLKKGKKRFNEPLIVTVQRERDGEILEILIDDNSRDMVSSPMMDDDDDLDDDDLDDDELGYENVSSNGAIGDGENDYLMLETPPL